MGRGFRDLRFSAVGYLAGIFGTYLFMGWEWELISCNTTMIFELNSLIN